MNISNCGTRAPVHTLSGHATPSDFLDIAMVYLFVALERFSF